MLKLNNFVPGFKKINTKISWQKKKQMISGKENLLIKSL